MTASAAPISNLSARAILALRMQAFFGELENKYFGTGMAPAGPGALTDAFTPPLWHDAKSRSRDLQTR
jgi:hypothetical protein